ncbi:MAG: DNA recombination protein RmuC, partial [Phycisphaerales bacterium]
EITTALKTFQDAVRVQLDESALHTRRSLAEVVTGLGKVSESNELRMETLRTVVESRLKEIQEDNTKKLDLVRQTVDEKLEGTLERRLGESFKLVSERLEQVHKGLGEMQSLATGVGDLKKVLSNVKSRGTWGEYQLGGLLEQVLTPEQYAQNVATKPGSNERVEFAIRLPGPHDDPSRPLWLPIDAKCPVEDYRRIVDATEQGDVDGAREGIKQLEVRIRACAESISSKYLSPPDTTDFGVLFVPTEGLYAEILRTPGLAESLQHEHRVMVAGPTTLWALLSSLQMGFRTLAIEKRSSEVWNVLSAVKTEFAKFEVVFKKVKKKLVEASNTIDDASRRTRAVERSLRTVHELPLPAAAQLLGLPESNSDTEADALSPTSSEGQ